jgi:hypothetical protein
MAHPQPMKCPRCGFQNPANATACGSCGLPRSTPTSGNAPSSLIRGEVAGYVAGVEGSITVWRFRVERFDQSTGNRMPPVAVEMRGASIRGLITPGDIVEFKAKPHGIVNLKRLKNVTTSSEVKVRRPFVMLPLIGFLMIPGGIALSAAVKSPLGLIVSGLGLVLFFLVGILLNAKRNV